MIFLLKQSTNKTSRLTVKVAIQAGCGVESSRASLDDEQVGREVVLAHVGRDPRDRQQCEHKNHQESGEQLVS